MKQATLGLPPYRIFTSEEIEDSTNNFDPSNLIEEGAQGQVRYFSIMFMDSHLEFYNEMEPTSTRGSDMHLLSCSYSYIKVGSEMVQWS